MFSSVAQRRMRARKPIPASKAVQLQLHAHEEETQIAVDVLVGVEDVRAALVEQSRHARHKALAIGAIDQQNSRIFHVLTDYDIRRRRTNSECQRDCRTGPPQVVGDRRPKAQS